MPLMCRPALSMDVHGLHSDSISGVSMSGWLRVKTSAVRGQAGRKGVRWQALAGHAGWIACTCVQMERWSLPTWTILSPRPLALT